MTELSRSGTTHPAGKLVKRIDVPISEELEEALIGLAVIEGISKAEFARRLLDDAIFGRLSMVRRMTQTRGLSPSDEYPHAGGQGGRP